MTTIPAEALVFLDNLKKNNNREWFNAHKEQFKILESQMKTFYLGVYNLMKKHDDLSDHRAYRIYRDIRFSKDKTPFKNHFSAEFNRRKPELRGGYYLHIEPENQSFIGCGFWGPVKEDIDRVRMEWDLDTGEIRGILSDQKFKSVWGKMEGEKLKSAPAGYDKNNPNIDLINYKQWIFHHSFSDEEVLSADFAQKVDKCFQAIRPFFDYMSEVLTTDMNGVSLIR